MRLGSTSGFIAIGEVVNVEDDPSQSGKARVRWKTGSATQDQVGDDDLPWTSALRPSDDPSLGQTGGPHTGLRKGTTVVGIPLDGHGQDFLILGSMVRSGDGGRDSQTRFDSDVPQSAKVRENGGETQPRYGDVNGIVTEFSICKYAEEEGGPESKTCRFASIDDSIGTLGRVI